MPQQPLRSRHQHPLDGRGAASRGDAVPHIAPCAAPYAALSLKCDNASPATLRRNGTLPADEDPLGQQWYLCSLLTSISAITGSGGSRLHCICQTFKGRRQR